MIVHEHSAGYSVTEHLSPNDRIEFLIAYMQAWFVSQTCDSTIQE